MKNFVITAEVVNDLFRQLGYESVNLVIFSPVAAPYAISSAIVETENLRPRNQ